MIYLSIISKHKHIDLFLQLTELEFQKSEKISKLHFWEDFKSTVHVVVFPKSATKAHMLPLGLVHCLWPHTRVDRDHVRLLKLHPTKEFA